MMPHESCSEVLRNPCALTLGDEPLAGRVEHGAVQFWMSLPEFCVPLHNLVHCEVWEQPTRRWKRGIQQPFQDPMQWHLPLSCLGFQQAYRIGPDADKPPQVPLSCDVLCHEPTDLA